MEFARTRRRRRRRVRWRLLAAGAAFAVLTTPGAAAAGTNGAVTPLVDCYTVSGDTYTLVLGYSSTYASTRTLSHGNDDHVWPAAHQSEVPTSFAPGTHHGVATLQVTRSELDRNARWQLDGTTLVFASSLSTECTSTSLPAVALAFGPPVLTGLVAAGWFVVVRRRTSPAPRWTAV